VREKEREVFIGTGITNYLSRTTWRSTMSLVQKTMRSTTREGVGARYAQGGRAEAKRPGREACSDDREKGKRERWLRGMIMEGGMGKST
jgi:hypothetical protein